MEALLPSLPESSYQALVDQMPQMVWSTLPDGYHDYYNWRWYEFTGVPVGSTDGEKWNGMFHPEDQKKSWDIWHRCLKTGEPYEVEYRLRHHSGQYRWTLGRAMPIRNKQGEITRWIGTCTDIHEQKRLLEVNELLVGELSHRIKNIFAVVNALISLSSTDKSDVVEFVQVLKERIAALGNAHEFVRPHSEKSKPITDEPTFFGMLDRVFAALPAYRAGRVIVTGDDFNIDDQAATPLSLIFHELMTNALKYGALNNTDGTVTIRSTVTGATITIVWEEDDKREAAHNPGPAGFGTQLIDISVEAQLGGQLHRHWSTSGLQVRITVPTSSAHR
jgi:PAS domain S-box-containing protein